MKIDPFDIGRYIINNDTDRAHIVDMVARECSCEAFTILKRNPCKHLKAVEEMLNEKTKVSVHLDGRS